MEWLLYTSHNSRHFIYINSSNFIIFFDDRVSLFISGWPGTCHVYQAILELTGTTCLCSSECWDFRCVLSQAHVILTRIFDLGRSGARDIIPFKRAEAGACRAMALDHYMLLAFKNQKETGDWILKMSIKSTNTKKYNSVSLTIYMCSTPVISTLRSLMQEDHKAQACLDYTGTLSLKQIESDNMKTVASGNVNC